MYVDLSFTYRLRNFERFFKIDNVTDRAPPSVGSIVGICFDDPA